MKREEGLEAGNQYFHMMMQYNLSGISEHEIRRLNADMYLEFCPIGKNGYSVTCLQDNEVYKIPLSKLYFSSWMVCCILNGNFFTSWDASIIDAALENPPPIEAKQEFDSIMSRFGYQDKIIGFWMKLLKKKFCNFLASILDKLKELFFVYIQQILKAETRYEEPVQQSPPLLYRPQIAPNAPALN